MRAVVVTRHGGPDVLELQEVADPVAAAGQLLVEVEAAGVNYRDIHEREGAHPNAAPLVAGIEGAGTVTAVGDGVERFAVGDRVAWSSCAGSYAERIALDAAKAVRVPDGLSSEVAAAAILQGMTAQYLANTTFPVRPGDVALVHSAAGGVGLLLTQFVTQRGGTVIGTTSTGAKAEIARNAGAAEVIGYDGFAERVRELTGGDGADVVYDGLGRDALEENLRSLRRRGTLVVFGMRTGALGPLDTDRLLERSLAFTRTTLRDHTVTREELDARATDVFDGILAGRLEITIGGRYPLAHAAHAQADLESRATSGKLVLIPTEAAPA